MKTRRLALLVILMTWCTPASAVEPASRSQEVGVSGKNDPRLASFDTMMRASMAGHRVPGASLAVTRNGKLVYARGFGYADLSRGETVRPGLLF